MSEQISHISNITSNDFLAEPLGVENLGATCGVLKGDSTAVAGLKAGTILAKITATGKIVEYDNAGADGAEMAVGILSQDVALADRYVVASDGVKTDKEKAITYYKKGSVYEANLTGVDAPAKADLANITFV